MIGWYITIGILALILFLLLCPIKLIAEFDNDLVITLKYLFLKFTLYPRDEVIVKDVPKEQPKAKQKKEKNKYEIKDIYNAIKSASGYILPLLKKFKKFFSHCRINPLKIKIVMTGQEADELAINYGKVCSVYYPLLSGVEAIVPIKKIDSDLSVDYVKKENEIYFYGKIKVRVIYAIISGIGIIKTAINLYNDANKSLRKEAKK